MFVLFSSFQIDKNDFLCSQLYLLQALCGYFHFTKQMLKATVDYEVTLSLFFRMSKLVFFIDLSLQLIFI